MKDYIAYIEDGKTKVMETNGNSMALWDLCDEMGLKVIGMGGFNNKSSALIHADTIWRTE